MTRWLALLALLAACGRAPLTTPGPEAAAVQRLDWRGEAIEVRDVHAFVETGDALVVCTSTHTVVLEGGVEREAFLELSACRDLASLPAPGGDGRWLIAVDAQGKLRRAPDGAASDGGVIIADRFGLQDAEVSAVRAFGPSGAAFETRAALVVADGETVASFDIGPVTGLTTGGAFVAAMRGDQAFVLEAATGGQRTYDVHDLRSLALDNTGRLHALGDDALLIEDDGGALARVMGFERAQTSTHSPLGAMLHAHGRLWFVLDGELARFDDGVLSLSEGAALPHDAVLSAGASGSIWALAGGGLTRFWASSDSRDSARWQDVVRPIFLARCAGCHPDLDSEDAWRARLGRIYERVISDRAMPPDNATPLADEERRTIEVWLASQP